MKDEESKIASIPHCANCGLCLFKDKYAPQTKRSYEGFVLWGQHIITLILLAITFT